MSVAVDNQTTPETGPAAAADPVAGKHQRASQILGFGIVVAALVSGLATYTILTGLTPVAPTPRIIVGLLVVNGALVAGMVGMIAWQIRALVRERRRGRAGARLHVRVVALFALVAAMPALIVALFATVTLDRGLDRWFSERTRSIVETALVVAEAYIQEHGQVIRSDVAAMASDLDRSHDLWLNDRKRFDGLLRAQTALRSLAGSFIIDKDLKIVASVIKPELASAEFEGPTQEAMDKATANDLVIIGPGNTNQVRALVKLRQYDDLFLYVFRFVDQRVVDHLIETRAGKIEYDSMEDRRFGVQLTFALMYIGVALIFLLAAIWFGFWVADRLVAPIGKLIAAARQVSEGNLDSKVSMRKGEGDLATLGRTFNQMTAQLASQRRDLIDANHMLDTRRRFTEAVLSGVTAGVMGLDRQGHITLVNRSAVNLLERAESDLLGRPLGEAVPELAAIFATAHAKSSGLAEGQVLLKANGQDRNFTVRVTKEQASEAEHGYVVTFDDMTELVTAQRNSAWADIARRIAHEIKNPLTPIQLSAERLKRKYGKDIKVDREVFEQCTDTIIRQVGDIGRMVDEFSTFARMPKAVMEQRDICDVTKQAVFLQRVGSSEIEFDIDLPDKPIEFRFDRRLVNQAITNLVKNAIEATEARQEAAANGFRGRIGVSVYRSGAWVNVDVADNGIGLPKEGRQRLVEPYMTTREKGTGLGLAIVTKIMEEHQGKLSLHDTPEAVDGTLGALIRLSFPVTDATTQAAGAGESDDAQPLVPAG